MSLELTGTIKKIGETQNFASGFQKAELVLLTNEQYPQPINIEFLQDKIHLLDSVNIGDTATIHINIRGREWTSPQGEVKYFNSITGWKIDKKSGAQPTPTSSPQEEPEPEFNAPKGEPDQLAKSVFAEDEDDDLPF